MKENDLDFRLTGSAKNYRINFQYNGEHSEKEPKDFERVAVKMTAESSGNRFQVTVYANHVDSASTAEWYKNFVEHKTSHMMHTEHGSNEPEKLHFAIKGALTITSDTAPFDSTTYQLCFGQGHYSSTNNWHLCSPDITADENNKGGFLGDQQYYLTQDGTHGFEIMRVGDMTSCHSNDFFLDMAGGLKDFSFTPTAYKISEHQPYGGVECSFTDSQGKIVIKAGRHKTEGVKNWFYDEVHGGDSTKGAALGCNSISPFPHKLNFAVKGDLKYTVSNETIIVKDVVLAQGSTLDGVLDNWWLGGPNMHGVTTPVGGMVAQRIDSHVLKVRETTWSTAVGKADDRMSMAVQNIL